MKFLSENMKVVTWMIDRVGVPLLVCAFLAWVVVVKFEKLEEGLRRVSRNQMAMMKKMGVSVVRDGPARDVR